MRIAHLNLKLAVEALQRMHGSRSMLRGENLLRVISDSWCIASVLLCLIVVFVPDCIAQTPSGLVGISASGSYDRTQYDSVSLSSGNLVLDIPLLSYQQRGSLPPYTVSLNYNNQNWQLSYVIDSPGEQSQTTLVSYNRSGDYSAAFGIQLITNTSSGVTSEDLGPCPSVIELSIQGLPCELMINMLYDNTGGRHVMQSGKSIDGSGIVGGTLGGYNSGPIAWETPSSAIINGVLYTTPFGSPCANVGQCPLSIVSDQSNNSIILNWQQGQLTPNEMTDSIGRTFTGDAVGLSYGMITNYVLPGSNKSALTFAPGCYIAQYPGVNGSTLPIKYCYGQHTATTDFQETIPNDVGASGVVDGTTTFVGIDSITLPDESSWTFNYDPQWGDLTQITLPTGGVITYTWTSIATSVIKVPVLFGTVSVANYERAVSSRTLSDSNGTKQQMTYTYGGCPQGMTSDTQCTKVTDSAGNYTIHIFGLNRSLETEVDSYNSKGQLLRKQTKYYLIAGADPSLALAGDSNPTFPDLIYRQDTTLDDGRMSRDCWQYDGVVVDCTSGVLTDTNLPSRSFKYSSWSDGVIANLDPASPPDPIEYSLYYGNKTRETHYDYGAPGSGTPGPILSDTLTTYKWETSPTYEAAGLLRLPATVVVNNGSGQKVAETDYYYDENNGSPQGVYGNLTSVRKWVNTTNSYVTTQTIYDAQGMPVCQVDGRQNSTKIVYDATGLYPQSITSGIPSSNCNGNGVLTNTFQYDSSTGSLLKTTDSNQVVTQYAYKDPLGRVTQVKKAVGTGSESWTSYAYNSPTSTTVTSDKVMKGDGLLSTSISTDGFGRTITSTDPNGATTQTTYDYAGRVASVSNPYSSTGDPTYGITSYLYDALNRKTYLCQPDNGGSSSIPCTPQSAYQSWTYSGSTVTFQDENRNQSSRTSDALGRLKSIVESGSLQTAYSYDVLGNLLQVNQIGNGGSDAARVRTFNYDSVSRLLTASNPETGTLCYGTWSGSTCNSGYDGNGNLTAKTDARGVVTNYSYDALNRLLAKTYTNAPAGTLSSCYQYDSPSVTNGIGRLAAEWTQAGSCSSTPPSVPPAVYQSLRSYGAYDAMGRALTELQCAAGNCTSLSLPSQPPSNCASLSSAAGLQYCYDLAGNLLAYGNGVTTVAAGQYPQQAILFGQTFDSAGHLASVTSSWNDSTHPSTLFSSPSYTPFNALSSWLLGTKLTTTRSYDNRLRVTGQSSTQ